MTRKRKWRLAVAAAVLIAVCLVHAPILRGLAGLLIVDQPTDDFECVCIAAWGYSPAGRQYYDMAADLHRGKPACRILLVGPDPNRLEQIGA